MNFIKLPQFTPVAAGSKAVCEIPRWNLTLNRVQLVLGGTTFTKSLITDITVRIGQRPIWNCTGSDLDKINKYKGLYDQANHLTIDWNEHAAPDIAGKELGGIDMSALRENDRVYVDVTISGSASAPTLSGNGFFTAPQGNDVIKKLIKVPTPTLPAGRNDIPFSPNGALIQRAFIQYTGADWCAGTATSAVAGKGASAANTGDGVMGAITVSAGAKVGVYQLTIIEPGTNVGTFQIEDPDGIILTQKGTVATAYSAHGLAFTLADGATDFISGDGFKITVSEANDGNVNDLRVTVDGYPIWDDVACNDNRFLQKEYGKKPQTLMYIYDAIVDNNQSGAIPTKDVKSLMFRPDLTASDSLTVYFEVLDRTYNL